MKIIEIEERGKQEREKKIKSRGLREEERGFFFKEIKICDRLIIKA